MNVTEQIKFAEEISIRVVTSAGQYVEIGEAPTDEQVAMATIHGRQDAAMAIAMLGMMMKRQQVLQRWLYGIAALLAAALFQLH